MVAFLRNCSVKMTLRVFQSLSVVVGNEATYDKIIKKRNLKKFCPLPPPFPTTQNPKKWLNSYFLYTKIISDFVLD